MIVSIVVVWCLMSFMTYGLYNAYVASVLKDNELKEDKISSILLSMFGPFSFVAYAMTHWEVTGTLNIFKYGFKIR